MLSSLYVVIYIFVIVECFMVAKVVIIFDIAERRSLKTKAHVLTSMRFSITQLLRFLYAIVFTNSRTND